MRNLWKKRAVVAMLLASWCVQPVLAVDVASWTDLTSAIVGATNPVNINLTGNIIDFDGNTIMNGGQTTINGNGNSISATGGRHSINTGSLTLQNIIFENGSNTGSQNTGGAIRNYGDLVLGTGTIFRNNTASGRGGAVYLETGSALTVENGVQFIGNRVLTDPSGSGMGGAINVNVVKSPVVIKDNVVFNGNFAGNSGGAIFHSYNENDGSEQSMTIGNGAQFINNVGAKYAGAIHNKNQLSIGDNAMFKGNRGSWYGGAIVQQQGYVYPNGVKTPFVGNISTTIGNNAKFYDNGTGSGVAADGSTASYTTGSGGAIYNETGLISVGNDAIFGDSTNGGNKSSTFGGAIANAGKMVIGQRAKFGSNSSDQGGAIANFNDMEIGNGAEFTGNTSTSSGGALANTAKLTVGDDVSFGKYTVSGSGETAIYTVDSSAANTAVTDGGAIYSAGAGATAKIGNNASFAGNKASVGGAIATVNGAKTEIGHEAKFIGNKAVSANAEFGGGAIANRFGATTTIGNNALFADNTSDHQGGAIINQAASLSIGTGSKFYNNKANLSNGTYSGGAIYQDVDGTASVDPVAVSTKIGDGAEFIGNSARGAGAIYQYEAGKATDTSKIEIGKNAIFKKNTATTGSGGAIGSYDGTFSIDSGSSFTENSAAVNGGAIVNSNFSKNNAVMTIKGNSSFSKNVATSGSGGAIYNTGLLNLDTTAGNITFSENTANGEDNDIALVGNATNKAKLDLLGASNKIELNAVSGNTDSTINKATTNTLVLNGDNKKFLGIFNFSKGTVNVSSTGKFFGGTNNISGGNLNIEGALAGTNEITGGTVTMKSGSTTDTATINNIKGGNVNVSTGGTLAGTNNVSNGTVNVDGTLKGTNTITGGTVTLKDGSTLGGKNTISGGNVTLKGGSTSESDAEIILSNANVKLVLDTAAKDLALAGAIKGSVGTVEKTDGGALNIAGDQSAFTGDYVQKGGTTNVTGTDSDAAKFFGGNSTIEKGSVVLGNNSEISTGSNVSMNDGTSMNATDNSSINGDVNLKGSSSITTTGDVAINGKIISDSVDSSITNNGHLTISNDQSGYKGQYTQNSGITEVLDDSTFFGGISDINGGEFIFHKDAWLAGGDSQVNINNEDVILSLLGNHTLNGNKIDVNGGSFNLNNATLSGDSIISGDSTLSDTNLKFISGAGFGEDSNITLGDKTNINLGSGSVANGDTITVTKGSNLNMTSDNLDFKMDAKGDGNISVVQGKPTESAPDIKINSDNTGFSGNFTQTAGKVTVGDGAKFFGGTNNIAGGSTEFLTGSAIAGTNILSGTAEMIINDGTRFEDSTILNMAGGKLDLNTASSKELVLGMEINGSGGEINKNGEGTLKIADGINYGGIFNQNEGTTEVSGKFFGGTNNIIGGKVDMLAGSELAGVNNITGGEMIINSGADATKGSIAFGDASNGKLTLNSTDSSKAMEFNSKVSGTSGTIQKTGAGDLLLSGTGKELFKGIFENITGKTSSIGNFFGGVNNIKGGELELKETSKIVSGSTVDISSGASMSIADKAEVIIDGSVIGTGSVVNNGGLTITGDQSGFKGDFTQESGKTTVTSDGIFFGGNNTIEKGELALKQGASLTSNIFVDDFSVSFDLDGREILMSDHGLAITGNNGDTHYLNGSLNLKDASVKVDETTGITSDIYLGQGASIGNSDGSNPVKVGEFGATGVTLSLGSGAVTGEDQKFEIGGSSTINLTPIAGSGTLYLNSDIIGSAGATVLVDGTILDKDTGLKYDVGNVVINSDNSGFTGKYEQLDGSVTIGEGSIMFAGDNTVKGGDLTLTDGALLTSDITVDGTAKSGDLASGSPLIRFNGSVGEVTQDMITNGNFNFANVDESTADNVQINQGGLGLANGTIISNLVDDKLTLSNSATGVRFIEFTNGSGVDGNVVLGDKTGLGYGDGAYIKSGSTVTMENAELIFSNDKSGINYDVEIKGTGSIHKGGSAITNITSALTDAVLDVSADNGRLNFVNASSTTLKDMDVTKTANVNIFSDKATMGKVDIADSGAVNVFSNASSIGDVTVTGKDASLNIFGNSTVGDVVIKEATLGIFGNTNMGDLTLGSTLNMANGFINTLNTGAFTLTDNSEISFDANVRNNTIDTINAGSFDPTNAGASADPYKLIISNINFVQSPIDRNFKIDTNNLVQVGGSSAGADIQLKDGSILANTEMGKYLLTSSGTSGILTGSLVQLNPQMYRGQVATVASYANQLVVNNMLFDHMDILGKQLLAEEKANVYAATNPLFAPYQYSKKDGNLWYKAYGNFETISMTQGLNVKNNAYGSLIGADFPLINLKNGWKMVPTAYIGYNGAHQTFNGVGMYQNGAQVGAMGTAYKGDLITSLLAYGGGYANDMSVGGASDTTGNWFAGVASKTAYNFHLPADFILQPTALVSYNIFGNQNYGSNFGAMSMNTGFLNGVNVAPGVNLIWNKKTFSLYATAQMVFNIMGDVSGKAGNVDLNDVGMRHGYFEYGLGAMKKFKDRFTGYLQFTIRNGGRTGIGFQGGLQWKIGKEAPKKQTSKK